MARWPTGKAPAGWFLQPSGSQRIAQETGVSFEWLATGCGACKYEPQLDDIPGVIGMELVSDHLELRLLHALRAVPRRQQGRIIKTVEAHAGIYLADNLE